MTGKDLLDLKKGAGDFKARASGTSAEVEMLDSWKYAKQYENDLMEARWNMIVRAEHLVINAFMSAMVLTALGLMGVYGVVFFRPDLIDPVSAWLFADEVLHEVNNIF